MIPFIFNLFKRREYSYSCYVYLDSRTIHVSGGLEVSWDFRWPEYGELREDIHAIVKEYVKGNYDLEVENSKIFICHLSKL